MNALKKGMLLALCTTLVAMASVMGTLAYLQSQTEPIKNTLTAGQVSISLDEAAVNAYGEKLDIHNNVWVEGKSLAERVTENYYKLIPGRIYTKDPTIHVQKGSEPCYLFVKVDNAIKAIEGNDNTIEAQMRKNGWNQLDSDIWYHEDIWDARNAEKGLDAFVFSQFTVSTDLNNEKLKEYSAKTIEITAFAVQADGFANAEAAWNATFGDSASGN